MNLELEQREPLLQECLHSLEDGYLLLEVKRTLLIEDAAEDVLELDDGHHLVH